MQLLYYFTVGLVLKWLHSLETCCISFLLLPPSHTQNDSNFCNLKVQSWLHPSKDASIFPRLFLLQNWHKQQRNANEQVYTEVSPKTSDLFSWNQSKEASLKVKGIPDNPHQMSWPELLVSSYRKNQWLRHTYTLSTAYTEVQRCYSAAVGTETLPRHPDILWETLEEKPWVCITH